MAEPEHNRMARRLEMRPLADLVPYEGNARTHSPAQVEQIAASIAELGFNNPILIDSKCRVIAGHGRLAAAKRLGLDQVPVVVLDHLSDRERRAYILADNRIAENAGWDQSLLADELTWLAADGMQLDALGFSDEELADLIDERVVHVSAHERVIGGRVEGTDMPELPTGDKPDQRQFTFTLTGAQAGTVEAAVRASLQQNPGCGDDGRNKNGDALYYICTHYLADCPVTETPGHTDEVF